MAAAPFPFPASMTWPARARPPGPGRERRRAVRVPPLLDVARALSTPDGSGTSAIGPRIRRPVPGLPVGIRLPVDAVTAPVLLRLLHRPGGTVAP